MPSADPRGCRCPTQVDRRQSDQMALAGVCGGQQPPRSSLPCGRHEPSDPKSARPFSPKAFVACRQMWGLSAHGTRYTCHLQEFNLARYLDRAPRTDPQNVWARSDLRGKKLKASRAMICASRGPAFGLCGRPTPLRWGEEAAAPA